MTRILDGSGRRGAALVALLGLAGCAGGTMPIQTSQYHSSVGPGLFAFRQNEFTKQFIMADPPTPAAAAVASHSPHAITAAVSGGRTVVFGGTPAATGGNFVGAPTSAGHAVSAGHAAAAGHGGGGGSGAAGGR